MANLNQNSYYCDWWNKRPQTGSTGDGYRFAKNLGHTITELFPTEVPITSSESFIKNKTLKGLSLKDVELSVLKKNGKNVLVIKWI